MRSSFFEKQKIRCLKHPDEDITNYCVENNCFVELCATCICSHTNYHSDLGTKPNYLTIKEAYSLTCERLDNLKNKLINEKARARNAMDQIHIGKKNAKQLLKKARQDAIETVNNTFNELEIELEDLHEKEKQKNGHSLRKLDDIYINIGQQSLDVLQMEKDLREIKSYSLLKEINNCFITNKMSLMNNLSSELSTYELLRIDISYDQGKINNLQNSIKSLISASFGYPKSVVYTATSRPSRIIETNYPAYYSRTVYESPNITIRSLEKSNDYHSKALLPLSKRASNISKRTSASSSSSYFNSDYFEKDNIDSSPGTKNSIYSTTYKN